MEAFAIAVYAVAGLVAAPIFCFCVSRYASRFPQLSVIVRWGSIAVLVMFAIDLLWIYFAGAARMRATLGPAFFLFHDPATLLAAPAFAFVILTSHQRLSRWWPAIAALAWFLGVFAIFHLYSVTDALYGDPGHPVSS